MPPRRREPPALAFPPSRPRVTGAHNLDDLAPTHRISHPASPGGAKHPQIITFIAAASPAQPSVRDPRSALRRYLAPPSALDLTSASGVTGTAPSPRRQIRTAALPTPPRARNPRSPAALPTPLPAHNPRPPSRRCRHHPQPATPRSALSGVPAPPRAAILWSWRVSRFAIFWIACRSTAPRGCSVIALRAPDGAVTRRGADQVRCKIHAG